VLFEGTVGSTGISLATVGRAKGYGCCIVMPDDVAMDKVLVLEKLGAKVERVRPGESSALLLRAKLNMELASSMRNR
jgi:cysteine synthase